MEGAFMVILPICFYTGTAIVDLWFRVDDGSIILIGTQMDEL